MHTARFPRRRFPGDSLIGRLLILIAFAAAVGIITGVLLPSLSGTVGEMTGEFVAEGGAAETLLALPAADRPRSRAPYDRDLFGFRERDADGDGCDVREEVLERDLEQVHHVAAGLCTVRSGLLSDPYTGESINFARGPTTSAKVQIDHVVALENAWESGASGWRADRRYQFGNDPYNMLAVSGEANQKKGSASAAHWLPERVAFRCPYVARQIAVKAKYGLSVTGGERRAMFGVLHSCPGQTLPRG